MRKRMTRFGQMKWKGVTLLAMATALFLFIVWTCFINPTRIAFVNFSDHKVAQLLEANENRFVQLDRFAAEELEDINFNRYTAIYILRLGDSPTEAQLTILRGLLEKKCRVVVFSSESRQSELTNLSEKEADTLIAYLNNGGRQNLAAFYNYNRRVLDKKRLFSDPFGEPVKLPDDVFYRPDGRVFFTTYEEYQAHYEEQGLYTIGSPRVCVVTYSWGLRNSGRRYTRRLVELLEKRGINVYPIAGRGKRLEFILEVKPDLIITTTLGRFGRGEADQGPTLVHDLNSPLLHPVDVHRPYEEWQKDKRGISGGLTSQQIVIPEIDGAIEPFTISAQFPDRQGLHLLNDIPGRLETLVARTERWLTLKRKPSLEKRIAIVYFKSPGQNALRAAGLEVTASLLNLLGTLEANGFHTGPLPNTVQELTQMIQRKGPVLGTYARGAYDDFLAQGDPELIPTETYLSWCQQALTEEMYDNVEQLYGLAPGQYFSVLREDKSYIALPRLQFGNIVLLPQLPPALGDDRFKLIHGVKKAPPHPYIATYLWARFGFKADAIIHFGTHGSLEFTPWKQVTLAADDWPDALLGDLPHLYLYVINNIGEATIAKRRSYGTIISYLTPPFSQSGLYGEMRKLHEAINSYAETQDPALREKYIHTIRTLVLEAQLDKALELEDTEKHGLSENELERVHHHLHDVEQAKITHGLYTLGIPYTPEQIRDTVAQMVVDPLSYTMARLDAAKGRVNEKQIHDPHFFDENYREKAFKIIENILSGHKIPESYLTAEDTASLAAAGRSGQKSSNSGDVPYLEALRTYRNTLFAVSEYEKALEHSTKNELDSVINGLTGGYILPSSGADPIANPEAVPTGRNLYSIDVEKTPTPEAWEVGMELAQSTIEKKRRKTGLYPKKVVVTLWGGEYIRSRGVALAMIFHFLGVEPVRDARGKVVDVRLVSSAKLGRPRIDVVVQTSGQFRDIGSSRIDLINRAVELAADADDPTTYPNYVRESALTAERIIKEKGLSPLDARIFSRARVFGSVDGNYGTGIIHMVEAGDRWEKEAEIADRYLKNMGAIYMKGYWGHYAPGIFEGALQNTDTVVHKRSSNVWGPLSLDHVYEFMGGISAAVRHVTGKDPDAYFSDLRNKHNAYVQGAKEAIWAESRSTLMNPKYIEKLKEGGASAAQEFAKAFRNTYGWNVTKPQEIDPELWKGFYEVYLKDKYQLGIEKFFRENNPYALQEMTAVMLETIRKGYWEADQDIQTNLAQLHAKLVRDYKAGCSGFVCDNAKLRQMISGLIMPELARSYNDSVNNVRIGGPQKTVKGMKLERHTLELKKAKKIVSQNMPAILTLLTIVMLFTMAVILGVRKQRR
jgi:cobaltochelatase CobN